MSDVVPVFATSVWWSSSWGFYFETPGYLKALVHHKRRRAVVVNLFPWLFHYKRLSAPISSKSSCFILKILSVWLPLDACNLYTFVWFSLCASACLTLLRMIWLVMRLMFLMSKAANKSVFVLSSASLFIFYFWGTIVRGVLMLFCWKFKVLFQEISLKIAWIFFFSKKAPYERTRQLKLWHFTSQKKG